MLPNFCIWLLYASIMVPKDGLSSRSATCIGGGFPMDYHLVQIRTSLEFVLKIQCVVFCKLHALYIHTLHGHIDPNIYI